MRVLVTSTPGAGHVHPVVPVAVALQDAGHDVLWAIAPDGRARVHGFGVRTVSAGMTSAERGAAFHDRIAGVFARAPRERRALLFSGLFGWVSAPRMLTDLRPVVDGFVPDVIVHDLAELSGAPLASARGIPHVTVAFSGELPTPVVAAAMDSVRGVWEAEGLALDDELGLYEHLYLHPFPPSLGQRPVDPRVHDLRPLHADGAAPDTRPPWASSLGSERPAVYVTFGERCPPSPRGPSCSTPSAPSTSTP